MKGTIMLCMSVMLALVVLTGCGCKHEWTDATCTSPQKCSKCNITNGQPISHNFSIATCQNPKQCTVCGAIEGGVLSHDWTEPTCSKPKNCKVCGVTEGEKLSHTPTDEWVTQKTDYIFAETVKVQTCCVCGEVVDREIIDLDTLHDGTFFLISAEDFITRLDNKLGSYSGNNYKAKSGTSGDDYACGILEGGKNVCVLMFTKNDDAVTKYKRNDSCAFNKLLGLCDEDALPRTACALMQAADPTITLDDAKGYAEEMLEYGSVSVNGVKYLAAQYSGQYFMGFTIE